MPHSIDYFDHPVMNERRVFLDTPAMDAMNNIVHHWVWHGLSGGFIYGRSRTGKSWAIRHLLEKLRNRNGTIIPTYYISMGERDQKTIRSVAARLCNSVNLHVTRYSNADQLVDLFIHHILDRTMEANCRTSVLFVDEAHKLTPTQFGIFSELFNTLDELKISLVTVTVFNEPECYDLLETLHTDKHSSLHGRFFRHGHMHTGLLSMEQVKHCLKQYDTLRFPENGPTYTEFFLPDEYANGWRYESLASQLWEAFIEYNNKLDISSWGMQYFVSAANMLLCDELTKHGVENVSNNMLGRCIELSGMVPELIRTIK